MRTVTYRDSVIWENGETYGVWNKSYGVSQPGLSGLCRSCQPWCSVEQFLAYDRLAEMPPISVDVGGHTYGRPGCRGNPGASGDSERHVS